VHPVTPPTSASNPPVPIGGTAPLPYAHQRTATTNAAKSTLASAESPVKTARARRHRPPIPQSHHSKTPSRTPRPRAPAQPDCQRRRLAVNQRENPAVPPRTRPARPPAPPTCGYPTPTPLPSPSRARLHRPPTPPSRPCQPPASPPSPPRTHPHEPVPPPTHGLQALTQPQRPPRTAQARPSAPTTRPCQLPTPPPGHPHARPQRLPKAALPRSCSVWAGVRVAGWGCRQLARPGRRC